MDLTGAIWRKASYSADTNCVEVALTGAAWRKASHSGSTNCVEVIRNVAGHPRVVAVRDSKNPDGRKLIVSAAAWSEFTAALHTTNNPA